MDLVTFGVPVAVIGVLLLLYNVLRFGAPFEFGVPYVLQGSPSYYEMTRRPDGSTGSFFDPTVLAQNLALYLFAVPSLHAFYPYLAFAHTPYSGTGFLFPDVRQYAGSLVEPPVFSIFLLAPTSLLVLLTPRLFLGGRRPAPRPVSMWAAAVALGLVPMLVLLSSSRGVTVRYAIDILPAFSLLGTLVLLARSTPALDVSVLRTPVAGRIGTPALGGKQATLLFALSSWGLSLVFGLMLGLGVWRYSFPAQALRTQAISDEWLGRWSSVVRPDTVPSSTAPTGRTSWRSVDGHYLKGGTIYLRVPGPGMVLILRFTSELPAGSELAVTLNGETVMRGPMLDDQQLWWTPPLTGESQGAVVPIRLDLPSRASMAPGSRMPLVVSSLRFARPDDIDLYRGPQAR